MRIVSIQSVCDEFIEAVSEINDYIAKCNIAFATEKKYQSFCYENAIIMLYKAFQTVDKALLLQGFAIVGTAFLI